MNALKAADLQGLSQGAVTEIATALRESNADQPVGVLSDATQDSILRVEGRVRDPKQFAELVVGRRGNLALTLGARGGVYIAGGIVPKLGPAFAHSQFRARFEDKGRFSAYLAAIPTFVIIRPDAALLGAAQLLEDAASG